MRRERWLSLTVVLVVGLLVGGGYKDAFALTDAERLQLLEDKFLKRETSEKVYLELRKKYKGRVEDVKQPVKEVPGNLVKNSSLEELDAKGVPVGWKMVSPSTGRTNMEIDQQVSHNGNQSVLFYPKAGKWSDWGITHIRQDLKLSPGKTYRVSYWVKGENIQRYPGSDGRECVGTLTYLDSQGKQKSIFMESTPRSEWKKYSYKAAIPAGATNLKITITMYNAKGKIWVDDVVVVEK